jgi:ABC-type multidrug transport system ATPase subunit
MLPPLLQCDAARIDDGASALVEGLSFATEGEHVGLVGTWEPLFAALAGRAQVSSGSVQVHGCQLGQAVARSVVGLALCEPGLPGGWSALDYLEQSARLAGCGAASARAQAREALHQLGLDQLGGRKLAMLAPAERRALLVAHATIGSPPVLALERPLANLDDAWARFTAEVIDRAATGRRLLVSCSAAAPGSPERELLARLDEVLLLRHACLLARGSVEQVLTAGTRYLVVVTRGAAALVQQLGEQGLRVQVLGPAAAPAHLAASSGAQLRTGDAARLLVEVGQAGQTDAIVEAALTAQAPIIELVPLSE